jgi:hypothetical protein
MTGPKGGLLLDHARVEADGLVERYVAGRLQAGVQEAFEAHFVDCAPCLEKIEEAERLRAGLAGLARESTAPLASVFGLASARRRVTTWALAAGLAAAGLAALLTGRQVREVRGQLEAARAEAIESGRRGAADRQALREAQASRSELQDRLARLDRPRIAPVFAMAISRGTAPARVLRIPRQPQWVVLSLEAGGDPEYRAVLRTAAGRVLWEGVGLAPTGDGLAVTLGSELLPPGDYLIAVTATAGRGAGEEIRFAFRTAWAH